MPHSKPQQKFRIIPTAFASALLLTACSLSLDFDEDIPPPQTELPDLLEDRDEQALAFSHPEDCAACHEEQVRDWEITPHAYAMKDPVFIAMVEMGQRDTEGRLGQFCVQCHSPTGLATEQTTVAFDEDLGRFRQNLELDPIGMSGVTCTACHSITNVVEPVNARVVYTPNGIMRGPIADPVDNEFHTSEYSVLHDHEEEDFGDLCGSCHNVVNPKGAAIEQTFNEFEVSMAKANGETCVSCHMPEYTGKAATGPDAPANLPDRTLHRHSFVGVDVSLLPPEEFPGFDEMRQLSAELLQASAEFEAGYDLEAQEITTRITNLAGHALPSGATAERQMWVELTIRNSTNDVVFRSGTLDEAGDLRDGLAKHTSEPGSDPQLQAYGQLLIAINGFADMSDAEKEAARAQIDEDCNSFAQGGLAMGSAGSVVDMPWQADWQCDFLIAPDQSQEDRYRIRLFEGNYTATARLLFRTFPPYFLRILEAEGGLDPAVKTRLPIVEMARQEFSFSVSPLPPLK